MALYDQEREAGMGDEIAQKMEALKEAPLKDLKAAYAEYFPGKKYTTPPIALSATHTWAARRSIIFLTLPFGKGWRRFGPVL